MPAGAFLYPKIASFSFLSKVFAVQCPQGLFLYPKIAPFYFFGGVSVSPGPEGDDDGERIFGHVQARHSITLRDHVGFFSASGRIF